MRRGGTPGRRRQLRLLPDAETADPRKPDAAPFRQRRGSRCTSIPTARMPSSMGLGASDATTATERSRTATMKNAPLKSARRRGLWKCGQGIRLAHSPTAEQNQKKRTDHALPKPDKFIRYRQRQEHELLPSDRVEAKRRAQPVGFERLSPSSNPRPTLSFTDESSITQYASSFMFHVNAMPPHLCQESPCVSPFMPVVLSL